MVKLDYLDGTQLYIEGSSSSANRNGIDNERRNAGDLTSSPDQIYRFSRIFLQESL